MGLELVGTRRLMCGSDGSGQGGLSSPYVPESS
jgi:hypothetical protein